MKPVVIHSAAEAELGAAARHYETARAGLGLEFLAEVERVTALLRSHPLRGARYRRTSYRYRLTRRFPFVIYYKELDDQIWIAAITHGKRRHRYWQRRRPET